MEKVYNNHVYNSFKKGVMEDINVFALHCEWCEWTALDHFEHESSPHITIESLKSDVKNYIKENKDYVEALCRRYEGKDIDEILEEIASGVDFLKNEDKFEEFMERVWYEHVNDVD